MGGKAEVGDHHLVSGVPDKGPCRALRLSVARMALELGIERIAPGRALFKQVVVGQRLGDEGSHLSAAARGSARLRAAGATRSASVARPVPPKTVEEFRRHGGR